jgi:hypothetical protein
MRDYPDNRIGTMTLDERHVDVAFLTEREAA